jgi:hypothetical protein
MNHDSDVEEEETGSGEGVKILIKSVDEPASLGEQSPSKTLEGATSKSNKQMLMSNKELLEKQFNQTQKVPVQRSSKGNKTNLADLLENEDVDWNMNDEPAPREFLQDDVLKVQKFVQNR